jgi:prolipoprotein diacylglyceryl transferase
MVAAYLPSPARVLWRLGPLAVHGYALCVVLGIAVAIWVAEHRYRAAGGRAGLIVDLATVVVPAGLIGARLYRVIVDFQLYFGHGRDWVDILRIWDGGLGLPGAAVAGLLAGWHWCRRNGIGLGPVLAAAVPGLALSQAVGVWGSWFAQNLYGSPSTWPWAVAISPAHRAPGYQSFGTFQPLFLYESLWDLLAVLLLIYLIRRLALTGDRALALCSGLYAAGRLGTASARLGGPAQLAELRIDQLAVVGVLIGAAAYLIATRARHGPEVLTTGSPRPPRGPYGPVRGAAEDMEPSPNAARVASGARRYVPADRPASDPQPDELVS